MILQPREIPEAIESLKNIDIDKVWFRGYTEKELCTILNRFVENTDYDFYWLISDDVIVGQEVWPLLRDAMGTYECVTGYCNLYQGSEYVNLTHTPLKKHFTTSHDDYNWISFDDIESQEDDIIESSFAGWAFTGMPRSVWLEHPFLINEFGQSDVCFSYRYCTIGENKIYSPKGAFIKHLKAHPMKACVEGWLVGEIEPETIYEGDRNYVAQKYC